MDGIKYAVSQQVCLGILTVKFSDGSIKHYDALKMAVEWFKMSNDCFYDIYGFSFNPHNWGNLYERARKIVYPDDMALINHARYRMNFQSCDRQKG